MDNLIPFKGKSGENHYFISKNIDDHSTEYDIFIFSRKTSDEKGEFIQSIASATDSHELIIEAKNKGANQFLFKRVKSKEEANAILADLEDNFHTQYTHVDGP